MPGKRRNSYPVAFKLHVIKFAEENGNRHVSIKLKKQMCGIGENRNMYWK